MIWWRLCITCLLWYLHQTVSKSRHAYIIWVTFHKLCTLLTLKSYYQFPHTSASQKAFFFSFKFYIWVNQPIFRRGGNNHNICAVSFQHFAYLLWFWLVCLPISWVVQQNPEMPSVICLTWHLLVWQYPLPWPHIWVMLHDVDSLPGSQRLFLPLLISWCT